MFTMFKRCICRRCAGEQSELHPFLASSSTDANSTLGRRTRRTLAIEGHRSGEGSRLSRSALSRADFTYFF